MKLVFEQLFYGRGSHGYGVLGASPGGAPLAERAEELCGAVGTPGADYGGEPFLLSVPEGNRVLMVCGRRGAPDSMNRETLFFHALVAAKKDLAAAKADAFSLFAQGAFAAKMPSGIVESLRIDCKADRDGSASRPPDGHAVGASLPCLVRSPSPAPDTVRAFVGGRANDLAWATFAFQPLDGFDMQVLPHRIAAPRSANEYDTDGKLVRAVETSGNARSPSGAPDKPSHSVRSASVPEPGNAQEHRPSIPNKISPMLKISLFANLVLVMVCVALFVTRKPDLVPPVPPPGPAVGADMVPKVDYDSVVSALQSTQTERDDAIRKAESERKIAESNRRALDAIVEQAKRIPGNLRELPGFKGFMAWKGSPAETEERKAFEAMQSIAVLISSITNQPTENIKH